jgi:hypothetical protein
MAQIRGTAGYNLGHQNPFGGPGSADATSDPSPLDAIREQTSKIEDWLDTLADPVKPYVPCPSVTLCFDLLFPPVLWSKSRESSKQGDSSHTLTPCSFTL